jgi:hypothetical protein
VDPRRNLPTDKLIDECLLLKLAKHRDGKARTLEGIAVRGHFECAYFSDMGSNGNAHCTI